MPITFTCPCGQTLAVGDEYAGSVVRCPSCQQTPIVPTQPAPAPSAKPWLKGQESEPTADPNNPFGFTDPATNARERERQAREGQPDSTGSGRSFEGKVLNGGVAGGALAMIGAVVWFIAGLAGDVIFFYPPVLFIIGLVAFVKGLAQGAGE